MICPHCNNENEILYFYCEKCLNKCSDISVSEFDRSFLSFLEETDEMNVFSYKSVFLILNEINNAWYNFGEFINYSDAINKKNELVSDGWPLPLNIINKEEMVSSNVFKKDGKFHVFNEIGGKRKIFGTFGTKEEAIKLKYDLVANNWYIDDIKIENIHETPSGNFSLKKHFGDDGLISFGTFESLDDAIFIKSLLESNEWNISKFGQDAEIYEREGLFYLIKVNNYDKIKILGKYDSRKKAEVYRDLDRNSNVESDGKIEGEYSFEEFKYSGNVYFINNKFHVQKTFNGNRVVFGKFSSEHMANVIRDILVDNDWNIDFFKVNNTFAIGEEFYKFKVLNNEIRYLGKCSSGSDAESNLNSFSGNFEGNANDKKNSQCHVKQSGGKFNVQTKVGREKVIFGRFSSENTANFVKTILNNNDLDINYFKYHNIFLFNENFYVFAIKNDSIKFLGRFASGEIAKKRLKKFDKVNDLDYDVSFSVVDDTFF